MACRRKMQCALVHFAQHLEDHEVRWNVFVLISFLNITFGRPRIALECFCFCRPPPPKHGTFPEPPRFGSAARDPTGVLHFELLNGSDWARKEPYLEELVFQSELQVPYFFPSPPRCARKRSSGEIKARQPKIARKRSGGALTCQGYKFVRGIDPSGTIQLCLT